MTVATKERDRTLQSNLVCITLLAFLGRRRSFQVLHVWMGVGLHLLLRHLLNDAAADPVDVVVAVAADAVDAWSQE